MKILENGVYFESDDFYHLRLGAENKILLLYVYLKDEEAKINLDFCFEFALATKQNLNLCKDLLPLLYAEQTGGLKSFVKWAKSPTKEQAKGVVLKDMLVYECEGLFSSELKVQDGRLLYTLEGDALGCSGSASFDFGVATKGKARRIEKAVCLFEQDYLMPFFWTVKHKNIDDAFKVEQYAKK